MLHVCFFYWTLQKGCPRYDTTLYLVERFYFWKFVGNVWQLQYKNYYYNYYYYYYYYSFESLWLLFF